MSLRFFWNSISNIFIRTSTSHFSGTILFGLAQGTPQRLVDLEVVGGDGGVGGGGGQLSLFQPSSYQYSEYNASRFDKADRTSVKFSIGLATAEFGCFYKVGDEHVI